MSNNQQNDHPPRQYNRLTRPDLAPERGWPEFIQTMRSAWSSFAQFRHGEDPEPCLNLFDRHYKFSTNSTLAYMAVDGEHEAWKKLKQAYIELYGELTPQARELLLALEETRTQAARRRHERNQEP